MSIVALLGEPKKISFELNDDGLLSASNKANKP